MKPSFFNDCLLAASSIEQGFTIVTHNIADFSLIARVEPRTSRLRCRDSGTLAASADRPHPPASTRSSAA